MSMTREQRRERVRRLADVPDAHIRIKWGRLAVTLIGALSIIGVSLEFGWVILAFIDRL